MCKVRKVYQGGGEHKITVGESGGAGFTIFRDRETLGSEGLRKPIQVPPGHLDRRAEED